MSRLAGYGPGEILDRLSILSLKMKHGLAAEKPIGHFVSEDVQLRGQLPIILDPYYLLADRLLDINTQLWAAEDALRRWRKDAPDAGACSEDSVLIARIAFSIQELNDQRAQTI